MLIQLTARSYYFPHQETTDRPNLGYLQGDLLALQIDAGNSPAHAACMAQAIQKAGLPVPAFTVLTHFHWDHTFGLPAAPGHSIAGAQTQAMLQVMATWEWTPAAMARRIALGEDMLFCEDRLLKEYPDLSRISLQPAALSFEGALALNLGNCPVAIFPLVNSHSPDCVVIHALSEGVLFLGDIHYADLLLQPPRYHREKLQSLYGKLAALDFEWCVPGHQPPLAKGELLLRLKEALERF